MTIKLEILNELLKYDYQKEYFKSLENNFDIRESDKTLELVRLVYNLFVQEFDNYSVIREFLDSREFCDFNRRNSIQWASLCYLYQIKYIVNEDVNLRKEILSILMKDLNDNKVMEEKRFNRVINGSEIASRIETRNKEKKLGREFYYTNSIALIIDMLKKNIYEFKDKEDSFLLQDNIICEINELKNILPTLEEIF